MAKQYLVARGTSTRASLDPESPDFETWVDWQPGDTAKSWPAHTPVGEFTESGAWVAAEPKRKAATQ